MSPYASYHVNRYSDNVSLVKSTDVIEKSEINLNVLQLILQLDIPTSAMMRLISRIIEMDYISFLITKTFLKSENKDFFYNQFNKVESMINEVGYDLSSLLITDKYKNIYQLFHSDKEMMRKYIHFLIYDSHKHKFIKEHVITFKFPDKFNYLITLQSKCIPVYNGTTMIDGTLYEMIQLFKQPHIEINAVKLAKLHDASMLKDINYLTKDNFIYIKTEDLKFEKNDYNIAV